LSDFEMLLKEQLPGLIRYATALTRDADEALDLVEDTVVEALDYPPSGIDLHVWLLTILHDHRANPFRHQADPAPPATDPAAEPSLSDFDRALGKLPEEQRAAILLAGLEGMSDSQTAAVLRIPLRAARSQLVRAKENLRRAMKLTADSQLAKAA
jgi:RNA polymerase sigma-70 factor (ECF subfamily)